MKSQKGFSAVETILLVIIVGLIGFTGWYVYTTQQNTNDSLDTAASTSDVTATNQQAAKYLTIKEAGVKFQLSSPIRDAYYAKVGNYYYFSLHRFDGLKGAEGCQAKAGTSPDGGSAYLGILALVTGKVGEDNGTPAGGTWTQTELDQSGMQKVGDTYYGFMGGNAPCWNVDNPPSKDFDQVVSKAKKEFVNQQKTFIKA